MVLFRSLNVSLSLKNYAEKHFGNQDWQKLVDDAEFNDRVLKDVQEACRKGGIERFETPQRVKVVLESWTPETGLVTDALKLKRKAIEQRYKDEIDDLYQDRRSQTASKTKRSQVSPQKSTASTSNEKPKDVANEIIAKKDE